MGNDANGIVACVKLKFFHLEGGGLNHQRDYQLIFFAPVPLMDTGRPQVDVATRKSFDLTGRARLLARSGCDCVCQSTRRFRSRSISIVPLVSTNLRKSCFGAAVSKPRSCLASQR